MAKGGLKLEVNGMDKVIKKMTGKSKSYREAAAAAVLQEAYKVDELSQKMVPVDTGRLRSSHYVSPPVNIRNIQAEVGYGTDYALPVHEKTGAALKSGFPKFLEEAMKMNSVGYKNRLMMRIKLNEKAGIGLSGIPSTAPKEPKTGSSGPRKRKRGRKKGV